MRAIKKILKSPSDIGHLITVLVLVTMITYVVTIFYFHLCVLVTMIYGSRAYHLIAVLTYISMIIPLRLRTKKLYWLGDLEKSKSYLIAGICLTLAFFISYLKIKTGTL